MKRNLTTCLIVFLLSCVIAPQPASALETKSDSTADPAVIDFLAEGLDLYRAKQYEAALPLLLSGLEVENEPARLARARIALARIFLTEKKYDRALAQIAAIPAKLRDTEARYLEGRALLAIDLTADGIATLQAIDATELMPGDQLIRFRLLAESLSALGDQHKALWFAHQGLRLAPPGKVSRFYEIARTIIAQKIDARTLPEIAFMFHDSPVGAAARLEMVRQALSREDREQARRQIEQANIGVIPGRYRNEAIQLYSTLTGESWLQPAIGVVLPLSGRFSAFGELVKRGMELARKDQPAESQPIRFLYRDGAADPARSRQAVRQLSTEDKALAIAGPITGAAAEAAARQAEAEKIPMMALSQQKGLPEIGPYVFRNSLTARLQAQELARYAVEELGMTSFGVLYPDNRLGIEMYDYFAEEVKKRNGLVIAAESYGEEDTDFGRQIRLLKGEDPSAGQEMTHQEILEDLFVPDFPPVAFDALFIPDYAERVAMIAPQLAYYGIEELPLLGISGWNSPELLRLAGSFVEGAIFVDGFFAYSPYPFVQEFVNRYFETYGEEPTILEAQGFDAANIFYTLVNRHDVRTRNDLRLALSRLSNYPGVTGATTFNMVGDADKVLFVLQVHNGNFVQINGPADIRKEESGNAVENPMFTD